MNPKSDPILLRIAFLSMTQCAWLLISPLAIIGSLIWLHSGSTTGTHARTLLALFPQPQLSWLILHMTHSDLKPEKHRHTNTNICLLDQTHTCVYPLNVHVCISTEFDWKWSWPLWECRRNSHWCCWCFKNCMVQNCIVKETFIF